MMKTTADANTHERFLVLLELFLRDDLHYNQKNLLLREIWQDKLWKYDFQSLREFVAWMHMQLNQFFRRIHSAKIHQQMRDAGITTVAPMGREVELLGKLPPEHRVAAWRAVIECIQNHGRSHALVSRTLTEYADGLLPPLAKRCQS